MRVWRTLTVLALAALLAGASASANEIEQSRGADAAVDYRALARLGPWDDRNYSLTAADIALLAPNEADLDEAIPVFYRVHLRREHPDLLRSGPVQYPRSALPYFLLEHQGYLIDGNFYRGSRREADGRWKVILEEPVGTLGEGGQILSLEGEVRITNPTGAAESSIEANPLNPDLLVAGSNGPGFGQNMHFSTDGGATWTQSANLPFGSTCCDPTIGFSSDGFFAYAATLGGGDAWFYRSSDNGQTWSDLANEPGGDPRREIGAGGFVDKEFLHVDLSPTSPFQDNIYLSWHESNTMRFARSTDFGHTWSAVTAFSGASDKQGIGSDITTDRSGNLYYFWPAFNSKMIWVGRSTDGGASFQPDVAVASTEGSFDFPIPSMETRRVFLYVSADTDRSNGPFADSIYAAWTDSTAPTVGQASGNHARIQVTYSRDAGATWTTVTPHPTADANTVDRWHQWLAVDPNGGVHLIFYDTQDDAARSSVNLYYTFSEDGAQTWSPLERLTTETSPNINDSFEFGDYNGLAATLDHVVAAFTDNRNESGGGGNSVDIYAAGRMIGGGTPTYTLQDTSPAQAGAVNSWTTTDGSPGGRNVIYRGASLGSSTVTIGPCNNVGLSLANAQRMVSSVADGSGTATASRNIPTAAAGRTMHFQAVDIGTCAISNTTTTGF